MREFIKKLDLEYGFGLTEEEITQIARQADKNAELFRVLHDLDLPEMPPLLTVKVERRHD